MTAAPITFAWTDDGTMVPLARFRRTCDRAFAVGETYPLVVQEERSRVSHAHYFASVTEAWKNLPEAIAERFPSSEHLRKWALIKAGYFHERSVACASPEEARKVAAFVRPMDEYAVVSVSGDVVRVYTAKSQSVRAMPKEEFQRSKTAVLEILSGLVGVSAGTLQDEAGRAA